MLRQTTSTFSVLLFAFIAGLILFPNFNSASALEGTPLNLKKIPLNAIKITSTPKSANGLTLNTPVCSNSRYLNLYQCLFEQKTLNLLTAPTPTPTPILEPVSSPKPTEKPILMSTSTPTPANTPLPLPTPTPTPTPVSYTPPGNSLNPDTYFNMINNHRASKGLPVYEKHPQLCELAVSRAPELNDEIFVNKNVHAGLYKKNLPYWITENMIGYPTEEIGFSWWMNSSIHRKAIESTDYKYACGSCSGVACAMLFTSFTPKN